MMTFAPARLLLVLFASSITFAFGQIQRQEELPSPRLPSGKSQQEEILKADHEKSLEDAAKLLSAAEELKIELEKNDRHVVSVISIKKAEDIEKLARRIRARLKRY